jgi:dihydroflavonol-4-reductase
MKTVVTGASGHIGVNLIRELVQQERDVLALVHDSNLGLEKLPIKTIKGDISDLASLISAFQDADVVYHLAAHISILKNSDKTCQSMNVTGVQNVIEACKRTGVRRLIHFSSIHSLSPEPHNLPVDESRPLANSNKTLPYDRSKALGETLIRQAMKEGLNAVTMKPTGVVGPYDYRPSHFGQALLMIAGGKLPALVNGGFNWVDVRDVAKYAVIAEQKAPAGSNYLLSGHWLSVKELAEKAVAVTGKRNPPFVCPLSIAKVCAPIVTIASQQIGVRPIFTSVSLDALERYRVISHAKATRELGYNPRSIDDTITDTINWFLDNGYLQE